VNAFTWLAKRKSANSTKNFETAGISLNPLGSIDVQWFKNAVSFACVTYQRTGSDKLKECLTALMALSHANTKGKWIHSVG
jgi:hypothetical protein